MNLNDDHQLAKFLAARKLRRGSYDDQGGDKDINIILAPSDLQNFEKQRNKFRESTARFLKRRSVSSIISPSLSHDNHNIIGNINSSNNNNNNNYIDNLHNDISNNNSKTKLLDNDYQLLLRSTSSRLLSNSDSISRVQVFHHHFDDTKSTSRSKNNDKNNKNNTRNIGDLELAKSILDQDYSLTVRLFIRKCALNWNFNSFTFDAICCGRSLTELLLHLFDYYNLYKKFQLDVINVLKCFRLLEFGYHGSNPYHNSVHAADVTQAMHCFIQEQKIRTYMTDLEILSSIMAAVCHDLDHPGVNQTFLINTKNPLAMLYNNQSVLENHHWRFALCIFKESQLFDHFKPEMYDQMKEQLKNLILATDIARQNEYLGRFQEVIHRTTQPINNNNTQQQREPSLEFSMKDTESRSLVLQIALKCADLGNPCRPWLISRVWSNLICDELFKMGKVERKLGIPLTPICQSEKTSIATIQTDFFRFIVMPLLELWHQFLQSPLSSLLMSNFEHNYQRWQRANRIVQQLKRRKSVASLYHTDADNAQIISLIIMKFYKAK